MHAIVDSYPVTAIEKIQSDTVVVANKTPRITVTTLYDVMSALQDTVEPNEDDLVVASMAHMLCTGRIRWVNAHGSLSPQDRLTRWR